MRNAAAECHGRDRPIYWQAFGHSAACALLAVTVAGCAVPNPAGRPPEDPPPAQPPAERAPTGEPSAPEGGQAILAWDTPGRRADGSCLGEPAGFLIRYGTDPHDLVRIERPTMDELDCVATGAATPCHEVKRCTYTVEPLTPATWYFVIHAYDGSGRVGVPSKVLHKVIETSSQPRGANGAP